MLSLNAPNSTIAGNRGTGTALVRFLPCTVLQFETPRTRPTPESGFPVRKTMALAWRAMAGFGLGTGTLPVGTPFKGLGRSG